MGSPLVEEASGECEVRWWEAWWWEVWWKEVWWRREAWWGCLVVGSPLVEKSSEEHQVRWWEELLLPRGTISTVREYLPRPQKMYKFLTAPRTP